MTLRHAALPAGAVLLLGIGIYLFHEVRTEPAIAQGERPPRPPKPAPAPEEHTPPPIRVGTGIVPQPQAQTPTVRPAMDQIKEPPPPLPEGPREVRFNTGPEQPSAKVDAIMDEANKAYDHGDFDEAKAIAGKVLAKYPQNVRMLRILVSASCIDGDTTLAQANFPKLPAGDQVQMRTRCDRYGVTFPETPKAQTAP